MPNHMKSILSSKDLINRSHVLDLSASERELINKTASGKVNEASREERRRALYTIESMGGKEEACILGKVLQNELESSDLRIIAATVLGRLASDISEVELISNLKIKDDAIRNKVVKSLGIVGGLDALKALDEIPDTGKEYMQKQLALSKSLISYRLGLERDDLPAKIESISKPVSFDCTLKFRIILTKPEIIRHALLCLEDSTYGISISENFAYSVSAGDSEWMLFVNKRIEKLPILEAILERRMILGLMALKAEETGTYSIQYLILTRPNNLSINILIPRIDGEIYYTGIANTYSREGKIEFLITNTNKPEIAPAWVKGAVSSEGDPTINEALISSKLKRKRFAEEFTRNLNNINKEN